MISCNLSALGAPAARGQESYVARVKNMPLSLEEFQALKGSVQFLGVTDQFIDVIDTFQTPEGETPAGFERKFLLDGDGVLRVDMVRNIAYD